MYWRRRDRYVRAIQVERRFSAPTPDTSGTARRRRWRWRTARKPSASFTRPSRFLTRISMGGRGRVVHASCPRPQSQWAAIVLVCGEVARRPPTHPFPERSASFWRARIVGSPIRTHAGLADAGRAPVWAFHGAKDEVVPGTESRFDVGRAAPDRGNVPLTEYPNGGQRYLGTAYAERDVPWMLQQKLNDE